MFDTEKFLKDCNKLEEDKKRITAIIDTLLQEHDLVFVEMSSNPLDEKINKAINERKTFCNKINESDSLKRKMNILSADLEGYVLCLQLYELIGKIKPLEIPFKDIGYADVHLVGIVRGLNKLKGELEIDEEELLIYAYILARADIKKRIDGVVKKENKGFDENNINIKSLFKLYKWAKGNKWKEIKRVLMYDKYIKDVYNGLIDSYKRGLDLKKLMSAK